MSKIKNYDGNAEMSVSSDRQIFGRGKVISPILNSYIQYVVASNHTHTTKRKRQ